MSIHVQLSDAALKLLKKQQLRTTFLSIFISILVVVITGLFLGIFLLPNIVKETPVIVTYKSSLPQTNEEIQEKKSVTNRTNKPSAAPSHIAKVIAAQTNSPTSIPIPENVDIITNLDFGDDNQFGEAWNEGVDTNLGGGFAGIPQSMRKRCSVEDRLSRLLAEGGTPECETAVTKALDWFQRTQNRNGSWTKDHPVAMTGFSLLCYLGHCETPQSAKYGETVLKGISYLVDLGMKTDGRLSNKDATDVEWVYDHGIATYALAEAYTFCHLLRINVPNLDVVLKKAGDMIMEGQNKSGGWVYKFEEAPEGDNSVGFWQIQALKACKHNGLWKESTVTKHSQKALEWLKKSQGKNGAVGYRGDSKKSPGLTSGAVLCFQLWDRANSNEVRKGIKWLIKNSEFKWGDKDKGNLYYHYYNVQALMNQGGADWENYNLGFRDDLLNAQNPDGSWPNLAKDYESTVNVHMSTSLATLMLETYYRFLPGTGER